MIYICLIFSSNEMINFYSKIFKRSKTRKGFGVHSPFVYYFLTEVVQSKHQLYAYPIIKKLRTEFVKNKLGHNYSYKTNTYYQFLYRVSNYMNLNFISSVGDSNLISVFSLLYPSSASKAMVYSSQMNDLNSAAFLSEYISPERTCFISELLDVSIHFPKIDFLLFSSSQGISSDLLLPFFISCLPYIHDNTIVLVEDIHKSSSLKQFWQDLEKHESTTLMIDFFHFGIVFFNANYYKMMYYTFL